VIFRAARQARPRYAASTAHVGGPWSASSAGSSNGIPAPFIVHILTART